MTREADRVSAVLRNLPQRLHAAGISYRVRPILRALGLDLRPLDSTLDGQRAALLRDLGITCVLDGGAHWGEYGKRIRSWGYTGNIVSFEPNPNSYVRLVEAAAKSSPWQTFEVGLGDGPGISDLLLHGGTDSPLNSFADLSASGPLAPTERVETIAVRVDALDNIVVSEGILVDRALLKLDLQGWEAPALRDATQVLSQCQVVEVEVPLDHGLYTDSSVARNDIFGILRSAGFEPAAYHTERWFNGRPPDMDVLFRRF